MLELSLLFILLLTALSATGADRFAWSASSSRPFLWRSTQHSQQSSRAQQNLDETDGDSGDDCVVPAMAINSCHDADNQLCRSTSALLSSSPSTTNVGRYEHRSHEKLTFCSRAKLLATSQSSAFSSRLPVDKHNRPQSPRISKPPASPTNDPSSLNFWENMFCGAISRSVAQTLMHPANTMKTILQRSTTQTSKELLQPQQLRMLTRGAGANFLLSVPSGAVNYAVLEFVRKKLGQWLEGIDGDDESEGKRSGRKSLIGPSLDFLSSCVSTITCSVISTPQMVITDNIMAGNYPDLLGAIQGIGRNGVGGFYRGWWPGLVGKIPSYALTWTLFQQMKEVRLLFTDRPANDWDNMIMGSVASGTTVCIMIPMDTIKTRLVTQMANAPDAYKGIVDCAIRVAKDEGIGAFYRGLTPRLVSVVPMIAIQFSLYEFMRRKLSDRHLFEPMKILKPFNEGMYGREAAFEEALMEVAASSEDPNPAPHFLQRISTGQKIIPRDESRPKKKK